MRLLQNRIYQEDIRKIASLSLSWDALKDKLFMISGATGLIGTTLIHVIMEKNRTDDLNCIVTALGRNEDKARERFREYASSRLFQFIRCDINDAYGLNEVIGKCPDQDFIFHAASNTHPVSYAQDPVGTVITNIVGLNNLLSYAAAHNCKRFLFASSNEIYGENRGDTQLFDEKYCGYIDCNTLRAGYPESKRAGEALCQAYIRQSSLDVVIPRFTRSFGPALLENDTKALSQFLKKAVAGEDIILKSAGDQLYSYTYVMDAVGGFMTCLLKGCCGEAYNISYIGGNITLRELAAAIAGYVGKRVVYGVSDDTERVGYSKATKALLDGAKLQGLGWKPQFDLKTGLEHTIKIMRELRQQD